MAHTILFDQEVLLPIAQVGNVTFSTATPSAALVSRPPTHAHCTNASTRTLHIAHCTLHIARWRQRRGGGVGRVKHDSFLFGQIPTTYWTTYRTTYRTTYQTTYQTTI